MRIDLNADLGEGGANDEAILDSVSSINVACAWHAGSADEMLSLVRAARARKWRSARIRVFRTGRISAARK